MITITIINEDGRPECIFENDLFEGSEPVNHIKDYYPDITDDGIIDLYNEITTTWNNPNNFQTVIDNPPSEDIIDPVWNNNEWIEGDNSTNLKEFERINQIKEKAQNKIYEIAPPWKQANLTARAIELSNKLILGNELSKEEKSEMADIQAVWDEIKLIREASNLAEADGTESDDFNPIKYINTTKV